MVYRIKCISAVIGLTMVLSGSPSAARRSLIPDPTSTGSAVLVAGEPAYCAAQHNVGKLVLTVTNSGTIGLGSVYGAKVDCITGEPLKSCEYPKNSMSSYLFAGALWIGAVVGQDTLVSCGIGGWNPAWELFPDEAPAGYIEYRTTLDTTNPWNASAVSEQDLIAVYTDTFTNLPAIQPDELDGRPHIPLHIEVTQTSMAWSNPYAEDIVLFTFTLKNIGETPLQEMYIGLFADADILPISAQTGYGDDLSGFVEVVSDSGACASPETLNIAWSADNDGELGSASPLPNITGIQLLSLPTDSLAVSYNWWVSNSTAAGDFGPMQKDNLRNLGTGGSGTPIGDRNKYFYLRNGEKDYDQAFVASILPNDAVWSYPDQTYVYDIADGSDTRYLLSFGPLSIEPEASVTFATAYVAGEGFHTDASNALNNLNGANYHPEEYYSKLDFSDFVFNAKMARKIYDTPGIDTDLDGYFGEWVLCNDDTVWVKGDGVPDYMLPGPPPAPEVRCDPLPSATRIRFNGLRSETTPDAFDRQLDFEGYRVYLGSEGDAEAMVEVGSYDIANFLKYRYVRSTNEWIGYDQIFTLEELRCLYGTSCSDTTFDPTRYTISRPFFDRRYTVDSTFYFKPVGENAYRYGVSTSIRRTFPDQPYPTSLDPSSAQPEELTEDGYLKYFEYELLLSGLINDSCYSISVTAFDHGIPQRDMAMLESPVTGNIVQACAMPSNACCLDGYTGNTNCDESNVRNLVDVLRLIDYIYMSHVPLCCETEGNVDGDAEGIVDMSDIIRLIDAIYLTREPTSPCP